MLLDLNNPVHIIRLELGDTKDLQIYSDAEYQYYLDKNNGDLKQAIIESGHAILMKLSHGSRQRLDRIEFYGNQNFEQFMKALERKIAQLSGKASRGEVAAGATVFAGGVYRSETICNDDINRVDSVMWS